jgi:glycosyltransferase involved in cell wall biosynthesis
MLGAIVPAHNEEQTIRKVLGNIIRAGIDAQHIFVVDNNSSDKTAKYANEMHVNVVECNTKGYQAALNAGLIRLCKKNYRKFLIVDGDNEIEFQAIKEILSLREKYSFVVGQRNHIKRFGEKIINKYFFKYFGIKDLMCGLKMGEMNLYNKSNKLKFGIDLFRLSGCDKNKIFNLPIDLNPREETRLGNSILVNYNLIQNLIYFHFIKKNI